MAYADSTRGEDVVRSILDPMRRHHRRAGGKTRKTAHSYLLPAISNGWWRMMLPHMPPDCYDSQSHRRQSLVRLKHWILAYTVLPLLITSHPSHLSLHSSYRFPTQTSPKESPSVRVDEPRFEGYVKARTALTHGRPIHLGRSSRMLRYVPQHSITCDGSPSARLWVLMMERVI